MKLYKSQSAVLAVLLTLTVSSPVWAFGDIEYEQKQGQIGINKSHNSNSNRNYNTNLNRNSNKQGQLQGQGQGQAQGQGQGQLQSNVGLGSGNRTKTDVVVEGDYHPVQKKQDIPAFAPDAMASPATAPCYATWAGSAGALGLFSGGASGFVKDHGCAFGEVARRAFAIGDVKTAQLALDHMFRLVKEDAGIEEAEEQVASVLKDSSVTEGQRIAARAEGRFFTDDARSGDYTDGQLIGGGGFIH